MSVRVTFNVTRIDNGVYFVTIYIGIRIVLLGSCALIAAILGSTINVSLLHANSRVEPKIKQKPFF